MSMIVNVYKDKTTQKLKAIPSQLVVKILKGDKSRSCGLVELDLAQFVHASAGTNDASNHFQKTLKSPLEKCPDKDAQFHFTVSS